VSRTLDYAGFADLTESRPAKVAEIKPGVMYVDLDRITDKDFQDAVPRLQKAKGIIFDLRGYPSRVSTAPISHLIEKPVTSAQWRVPVTLYPDRRDMAFDFSNWEVKPRAPRFTAKVAFVTDGRAISYAETYMGIIEHYKLAAIVGSPTAGTNGNINPFTLPGRYRVVWTGMQVLKHDGSRHHGVGIQPTVPVERTIRGVAEGRDELLERAAKVVRP
jgi:C-terminal processing protease CtpA/Prc